MDSNTTYLWSAEKIVAVALLSLLTPVILAGNLLVIVAVIRFRHLQSATNFFLLSLAVADVCAGLFAPLLIAEEILKPSISQRLLCLGPHCLLNTVCGVSVLCLAAIAYDRYTALTRPLEYAVVVTFRRTLAFTAFAWSYAAAIAWLPLVVQPLPSDAACSFRLVHAGPVAALLGGLFLPSYFVIFFCYARIFCIARHHAGAIAATQTSLQRQIELRFVGKDTKYAKTLAIVVGLFLLLWLPYQICLVAELVSDVHVDDWVRDFLALLSCCNSGINPWIYAFRTQDFKRAFADLLFQCCYRDDPYSSRTLSGFLKARTDDSRHGSWGYCTPSWSTHSRKGSAPRRCSVVTMATSSDSEGIYQAVVPVEVTSTSPQIQDFQSSKAIAINPPAIIVDPCEDSGGCSPLSDSSFTSVSSSSQHSFYEASPLAGPDMAYLTVPKKH